MNIDVTLPIHLLHSHDVGTLATHTREPAGFPYPSAVPYATDARHRPVVLISALADHTRNLRSDPRAGFLVADAAGIGEAGRTTASGGTAVLEAARASWIGHFVRVEDDPHLVARYLRVHPDAQRYLALGDFAFWALEGERVRYIGGFARMGWTEASPPPAAGPLSFDEERACWEACRTLPDGVELLGVDRLGSDWRIGGQRKRRPFGESLLDIATLESALREIAVSLHA